VTEGGSVTSHLVAGAGRRALWARLRRVPPGLLLASVAVVGVLLAPLAFLLLESSGAGAATVGHLVWRQLTATLLWNTVRLTLVVTALCAVIGTLAAWCVERTDLPGRRIWAVLVVIPFAIPDFVISFGWASSTRSSTCRSPPRCGARTRASRRRHGASAWAGCGRSSG